MSDDADQTEQLRGIVGTVLPPDLRDSFVEYSKLDAFRGEDGQLDTEKVMGHLTAVHLATQRQQQQSQRSWGQHSSGGGPGKQPGDDARAALEKRHGVKRSTDQPAAGAQIPRGQSAREALAQRHGVKK
jgi:hypothetical protein